MKSANWISATGMRPLSAAPMATPTMADSARGVSSTRDSPKRAYRPSVAPNTPPLRPTSSPSTRTRSSRSISSPMAARTASIIRISGMEQIVHRFGRFRHGGAAGLLQGRLDHADAVALDLVVALVVEQPQIGQLPAHALDRVVTGRRLELVLSLEVSSRSAGGEGGDPGVDERRSFA